MPWRLGARFSVPVSFTQQAGKVGHLVAVGLNLLTVGGFQRLPFLEENGAPELVFLGHLAILEDVEGAAVLQTVRLLAAAASAANDSVAIMPMTEAATTAKIFD